MLVDTLRADALGAYGNPRDLSPTIDAIAAEGVLFERAIASSPWTQPSMASLFSSFNPGVHGVVSYAAAFSALYGDAEKVAVFDDTFTTLAESLRAHGYETAGFVANPFLLEPFGFSQGFEYYDASFAGNRTPGDRVNEAAVQWLRQREHDGPFFLYLHYMDVHGPYDGNLRDLDALLDEVDRLPAKQPLTVAELDALDYLDRLPREYHDAERHARLRPYREYWVARYEAGVKQVDHYLAELRRQLDQLGVWDGAYVIVTSDHGESLCEHGTWDHGLSTFDTELHVPLVLRWPARLQPGARYRHRVRLIDLLPTMRDQLGLPPLERAQGRSIAAWIDAPDSGTDLPAFAEALSVGPEQKALYDGGWKLMLYPDHFELFDLETDPGENEDVAARRPEIARRMRERLERQLAENHRLADDVRVRFEELTPEQIERLRSLGYLH